MAGGGLLLRVRCGMPQAGDGAAWGACGDLVGSRRFGRDARREARPSCVLTSLLGSCAAGRRQAGMAGGLNGDDGLRLRVWQCKSMGASRTRWSVPQGIAG
jgi:hypothetical protein